MPGDSARGRVAAGGRPAAMRPGDAPALALALPDAAEAPHFHYRSFRVRGRIFATLPLDGEHLHVFVGEPVRDQALAMDPHCLAPLHWGLKVVGLRVQLSKAPIALVRQLLEEAWLAKAPPAVVKAVSGTVSGSRQPDPRTEPPAR